MSGEGIISNRRRMTNRLRRGFISCPICNDACGIRDTTVVTELVKDLYVHCHNTSCGHTFKMQLSFVHTISPSAIERDDVDLPQCPPEFIRHIYPAGPPGSAPAPDPNQLAMFGDEGDGGDDEAPRKAAAG